MLYKPKPVSRAKSGFSLMKLSSASLIQKVYLAIFFIFSLAQFALSHRSRVWARSSPLVMFRHRV